MSPELLPGGPYRTEFIGYIEDHLDHMRRNDLAQSTMKSRRMVLTWLAEFLGHDPAVATFTELDRWQSSLPTSQVRWKTAMIRPYYSYLQARGIRRDNPAALLPKGRRKRRVRRPISEDALFAAVAEAPMPVLAYLLLAGWCGLRAVEIARVDREHFDRDFDDVMTLVVHGKGNDWRIVPVPEWVWAAIEPHLPDTGPCFTRIYGDDATRAQRVKPKQVTDNANYYLRVVREVPDRLHSLRHRVATALWYDTQDVRLLQEFLGHSNLASLHVYTHVAPRAMAAAAGRVPRPPRVSAGEPRPNVGRFTGLAESA